MDINTFLDPNILSQLQTGGYFIMFILMILEGPLVTLIAAFLASLGYFDIYIVFILGWAGDFIGDMLFYSIGHYGSQLFSKKTVVHNRKEETFIEQLDTLIHRNLLLPLLVIKFTPYAPPLGLSYIGKIGVPLRKYIFNSLLSCIPIPIFSILAGLHIKYLMSLWQKSSWLEIFIGGSIVLIGIALLVGSYVYLRKKSLKILENNGKK